MGINTILFVLASIFLVYAIGAAILTGAWKQLLVAFILFVITIIAEIIFASLSN